MPDDCTSIAQLAKACGVTHRTAAQWLKHPRFPLQREAPWSSDDVAEIRVWREQVLQPNRADPRYQGRTSVEPVKEEQTKDYWLMRKYRAQALEAEGKLCATDDMVARAVQVFTEARSRLLMVPASLKTLCDGVSGDEVERRADELIRAALDGLADRLGDTQGDEADDGGDREGDPDAPAAEAEPMG